MNIPLTIALPGAGQGRVSAAIVSQIDLLPTLCDLAGVDPPAGLDGVSLRAVLEGGGLDRDELFAEYHSKQRWANPIRTVRTDRWKLNAYLEGEMELYDLDADPHETRNLAGTPQAAAVERELLGRLDEHATRTQDALWLDARKKGSAP